MDPFIPLSALSGGLLIGMAACLLLLFNGRIAGVTGIVKRVWPPVQGDVSWRVLFIVGLMLGAGTYAALTGQGVGHRTGVTPLLLVVAGLLTGFGTSMGEGCTSGHGVCGMARLSKRSIVATVCFLSAGIAMTYVVRHVFGVVL